MTKGGLNPVLERCLAIAGRQQGGQIFRLAFLWTTAALIVAGLVLVPGLTGDVDPRALAAGGGRLLELVATAQVAAACILTPLFMASALQRDADPTSWDVMRSTPLRPWRIITGLLAGRAIPVLALVLATLPLLLLLRVAGGVPLKAVLASTAIALGVTFTASTAAVLFAAARMGARAAIMSYLVLIAVALSLTWGFDMAVASTPDASGLRSMSVFTALNPFLVLDTQLRPGAFAESIGWWSGSPLRSFLLLCGAISVLCWVLALALSLRDTPWRLPQRKSGRAHRPIGRHPIAWRESSGRPHAGVTTTIRWTLAALILIGGCTLALLAIEAATARALLAALLVAAGGGLFTVGTLTAAAAVARERDDRTLDLLLTTPLDGRDYLRGKITGLAGLLWPPTAATVVVALIAALLTVAIPPSDDQALAPMPWAALLACGLSLPGLLALGLAVGLAWSVRSRRWTTAAAASLTISGVFVVGLTAMVAAIAGDVGQLGTALLGFNPLLSPAVAADADAWLGPGDEATFALITGGCVGAVVLSSAAVIVFKTTAQTFTPTVRRLAGLD